MGSKMKIIKRLHRIVGGRVARGGPRFAGLAAEQ